MNTYSLIFRYISSQKGKIVLYFVYVLLSILFSIISLGMLMPFLQLIFTGKAVIAETDNTLLQSVNNLLNNSLRLRGTEATLGIICILMIFFIFLKNLFLYLSHTVMNPLKNSVVNRFRESLYDKILKLPIGYFNEKRKGDLMSRISNDVSEVEVSVVGTLEGWIKDPLTIIVTLIVLFLISPELTIFILLLIPLLGLVIGKITRSLKKHSADVARKNADSFSIIEETLGGLRVIKAFNIEKLLRERFFKTSGQLLSSKNKVSYRRDLASPLSEVLGVTLFTLVLYYGGRLVLKGQLLEASAFLGFLGIFYNIINPAKALSGAFSNMRKGAAALNRINEVLHAPVTVDENPGGKQLTEFRSGIEFRNVCFSYEDAIILNKISLFIEKGKTIALVGSSGAGKSTLADLVPRFHDVSSGEVLIDGMNIKEYSLQSVRNLMGIVTQEPILFNDSIASNIALGKPGASEAEIIEASKIANAHEFIIQKEEGYRSNIGDRGSKLSGGERQRLTIARAVLKNPPILILDEATSSLDTESERLVQDAINHMMQNRTSIVIAHRLSTVRHADEIIVLQKGEIAERGNHEQLMKQNGIYRKLVDMQEVR